MFLKKIDPYLIKRINRSVKEKFVDKNALITTRNRLDELGRYRVDQTVKECGYENVLRVFAVRILVSHWDFSSEAIELARQIPNPLPNLNSFYYTQMHPALVEDNFIRLLKPNLIEE